MGFFVRARVVGTDRALPIAISGDGAVTTEDLASSLARLLPPGPDPIIADDQDLTAATRLVGDLELLADGVTISRERHHPPQEPPIADTEIWVNGGLAAGWAVPAPPGQYLIGRAAEAQVRIADPLLGRRHCQLTISPDGTVLAEDLGSRNGTYLEGRRLEEPTVLRPGATLRCGDSMVVVQPAPTAGAQLVEQPDGTALVHRREPEGTAPVVERVELPRPPEPADPPGLLADVGTAGAYAVATGGMAIIADSPRMLAFAAMAPLVGLFSALIRRRTTEKKDAREWEKYQTMHQKQLDKLTDLRASEANQARKSHPGPAEISRICSIPTRRLWERRSRDAAALEVRVGSVNAPSQVTTDDKGDPGLLWMVPLSVPLRTVGTLGIKGPIDAARAAARSALLQAAAIHGPDELKIVALLGENAVDDWDFLRWLPHLRGDLNEPDLTIAVGKGAVSDALGAVEKQLEDRAELLADQPAGSPPPSPQILVLVDTSDDLGDPRFLTLFNGGPKVGVCSLIVDQERLPDGCQSSLELDETGSATFERSGTPPVTDVLVDGTDPVRAERSARCLARLRPARRSGSEIPKTVRLLDLLDLPDPTADQIRQRWTATAADAGRKGVRGVIGHDGTGIVDLVLSQDIPNMLVAGAPGTGKSEFLLTLVAGLAAEQSPDEVQFIIIGFKGIQDFGLLKRLPHTLDVVGNLDARSFDRAMRMLENEIKRREIVLERAGVGNVDAYRSQRLAGDPRASRPLPRLIVIADEFAELKSNAPDQYARLESLTRLGRALGMHLILATQSPSGVVSGQMEATVPLRISFKLIGLALSREVIGDAAAGLLPMTAKGRAFMAGQGGGVVEAQMARVAGRRPDASADDPVLDVYLESLAETARPQRRRAGPAGDPPDEEKDLWGLVEACRLAAEAMGYDHDSVPWAGPLPSLVTLADLTDGTGPQAVVGLMDDPDSVADPEAQGADHPIQRPYALPLGDGHHCIFGTSGSGRSMALITSAAACAQADPTIHIYGIDNTSGGLALLGELPNCGGVAQRDHQLARRILEHLEQEVTHRYRLFRAARVANIDEFRRSQEEPLPDLLLIVDRLDELPIEARSSEPTAAAAQANLTIITKLLSEGAAAGLTVVASSGPNLSSGRLAEQFRYRLILRLSSRDDYGSFGIPTSRITDEIVDMIPPGRAMFTGAGRELQFAVAGGPERSQQRNEIRTDRPAPEGLVTIRDLPLEIFWSEIEQSTTITSVPLGIGDDLQPVCVDLSHGGPLLVAGPRRSGRSTALASLCQLLHEAGIRLGVVASAKSGLAQFLTTSGIEVWEPAPEPEDRYNQVEVLVFDDADLLLKIRDIDVQMKWAGLMGPTGVGFVASATIETVVDSSGQLAALLTGASRLHLQPSDRYQAREFLGLNLSNAEAVVGDYPPGRGVGVIDHDLHRPIHVPRPSPWR